MEVQSSLYGSLCRLFSLVSPDSGQDDCDSKRNCHFVGTDIEFECGRRNRYKRRAFEILLSVHAPEESTSSEEQFLQASIYNMRCAGLMKEADAIEDAIEELNRVGCLNDALPVLKLLVSIKPIEDKSIHQLRRIEPTGIEPGGTDLFVGWELYPMFDQALFEAPIMDYDNEKPYSLAVKEKLSSTNMIDVLDVAHSGLFGAILNPPKTLDYLGISNCTRLNLGIGNDFRTLGEDKNPSRGASPCDEGYESPCSTKPNITPPEPVPAYNCWEDLENLCNPARIRKTWESKLAGDQVPTKELPYLTQLPLSDMVHLWRHLEENLTLVDDTLPRRDCFTMDESELRKHLRYLMLGVESELFSYKNDIFQLNGNPIIQGTSPDCLVEMIEPCLECGRLIRRLNQAQWNPASGKVHDALVDQLHASLRHLQRLTEEIVETKSFAELVAQVHTILPTVRLMERLWSWSGWSCQSEKKNTGRGVAFLQHIVNLASAMIDEQERRLLTAYFVACARPFLTFLKRWLYRGQCCDPHHEFLIRPDSEQLNQRDRLYWTHGFSLDPISRDDPGPFVGSSVEDDAVLGLMADVYLCGKTVHLLQLCRAKVEDHDEPLLRIGLSLAELSSIRKECEQYALKSPAEVDFTRPVVNLGQVARAVREAKLAELTAQRKAKESDRAAERTARYVAAKAQLDEQLELKRAEIRRKEEEDRLVDQQIERYHEVLAQRDAQEKRRLLLKYARLLGDDENTETDGPPVQLEDEVNANEELDVKDEDNNVIAPVQQQSITPVPTTKDPPPKKDSTKTTATGKMKKSVTILTREDIRTKVLREEFGIDPRYTAPDESVQSEEGRPVTPSAEVSEPKICNWVAPAPESYPLCFDFDKLDDTAQPVRMEITDVSETKPMQMTLPCAEEIRDLSLSFFVQRSLLMPVRTQCQMVNRSLMTLLIGPEHRFMQHLEALRRYLFLDDGAFGHSIVSSIGHRLGQLKHVHQLINIPSMNFILQSALHAVRADEFFASRLSFYIKDLPVGHQHATTVSMEALDSFTLRYRVGWPINIVLTEEVMDDYSQIFCFVLQLRLAAWSMEDVFVHLKSCVKSEWRSIHVTRHAIYHFVQTLQSYVMNQLLTLSWQELLSDLKKRAKSMDDLYEVHSNYVRRAKSRLLLTPKSASLMKIIRDALGLALKFRNLLISADYVHTAQLQSQIKSLASKFRDYAKFLRLVLEKVNDRHQQSHLNELLVKLNFNGYYGSD